MDIWKQVCTAARMKYDTKSWDDRLKEMSKMTNKNNVWSVIRRLCFDDVVYYIWNERNARIFNSCNREENVLFENMC